MSACGYDGPVARVPFLAVKHSRGSTDTRRRYPTAAADATRQDFAAICARDWRSRPTGSPAPSGLPLPTFHDPAAVTRGARACASG